MNKKTLTIWSTIMIVVFVAITIAYPLIFKPGPESLTPNETGAPVSQPVMPGP